MSRRSHRVIGPDMNIRPNAAAEVSPVLARAASIKMKARFIAMWMPKLIRPHSGAS
jgi:hypothetical protein